MITTRVITFSAGLLGLGLAVSLQAGGWPAYRADASRSGYTSESLPVDLEVAWSYRASEVPRSAWPSSERMDYDRAFQPIQVEGLVIFGSSVDDQVYALDAATGRVRWTFYTEAPVRFAPAGWRDRVFVASDDGWLYALAARDGSVLWKHRGGPDERMFLGNDRMTSKWPARGGPVVIGDTVYYAAGIWPSEGVYVHALGASTGRAEWSSGDVGDIYMPQPHKGANARSGISAQGYLLADGDKLYVPTGRAVPAALNRGDGKLAYYHLQQNQQRGGTWAMLADRFLANGGQFFERTNGEARAAYKPGPMASTPDGLVQCNSNKLFVYRWKDLQRIDRKGQKEAYRGLEKHSEVDVPIVAKELIVAGSDAILGALGEVSVVDLKTGRVRWGQRVAGAALGFAAAEGRLVVSTDQGVIYCVAGKGRVAGSAAVSQPQRSEYSAAEGDSSVTALCDEIVRKTGVSEGFCVDLACGTGELALELARRTRLQVYGIESDPAKVASARRKLQQAGLYGTRVTIHQGDPARPPYPKYFADLIVSSAALSQAVAATDEVRRMQRPFGGVICLGKAGALKVDTRGALVGAGSWTHQNGDIANTLCSTDQWAKGPLKMLWFRDVPFSVPNRHGQAPAPLCHQGRLVAGGVDGLCCLDAYNGRTLWTFSIPGFLKEYDGIHHDVGVGDTGSGFCLSDDSVYVRWQDRCVRLDLASGRKLGEFAIPVRGSETNRSWGYLGYRDGLLYGSVNNESHTVSPRYAGLHLFTESVLFFALDAVTGKELWRYQPQQSIRHNSITVAGGRVYLIDRVLAMQDRVTSPKPNGRHGPLLKPGEHPGGTLLALDARSGRELWRQTNDVFGTQLAVSEPHGVLMMYYQAVRHNFFKLPSESGDRMAAIDAATGRRLWDRPLKYQTRPILHDGTIYALGGTWDLKSGAELSFKLEPSYGCGQVVGSPHLLLFRSATLGYVDLSSDSSTANYGGTRPGCWFNVIPAAGLVLAPDASSKCACSYQTQAWLALQPGE